MSPASPAPKAARLAFALNTILGRSQEQLARHLGVSFSTFNAWATGKRTPHPKHLASLEQSLAELTQMSGAGEERLRAALAVLHVEYGSPKLGNKADPLDELFFILLSLKTSHRTFEETFTQLKKSYFPWKKLLTAKSDDIEAMIRRGGLGSIKAKSFVDIAHRLQADFGQVTLAPLKKKSDDEVEEYLMSLPGIGIKTARCVMMYSLGRDVLPVDTHTYRVGVRLGLAPTSRTPQAAHSAFDTATPANLAYPLHTNLVAHGREVCLDPTPKCDKCRASHLCDYYTSRVASKDTPNETSDASRPKAVSPRRKLRAVDIYAGCGGLSLGIEMGGFELGYALDWDKHACATHEFNFPKTKVHCGDVIQVSGQEILKSLGGPVDLVAGGPNCPGVSERGLRSPDDPRNLMLPEFARLVEELQPRCFIMENVPGLAHRHNFGILQSVFQTFEKLGFNCAADVLLAADYGVPQLRYRFFLIGVSGDERLSFPMPTHAPSDESYTGKQPYRTVWDAIGDLPTIASDQQVDTALAYRTAPQNEFQKLMRGDCESIHNHVCSATEEINLLRASFIPEGGNWKDIPPEHLPDRFFACRMTDHSTTYARLRRNLPAFTITALFGNITAGAFTHPLANRAISIREGARIQSFPDRFKFQGPRNSQYRQIGNAVPPLLAASVAGHLKEIICGRKPEGIPPRITPEVISSGRGADAFPVLTPRFKQLFGQATRWPKGWGAEPGNPTERLDNNYMLRQEFWPVGISVNRRKAMPKKMEDETA